MRDTRGMATTLKVVVVAVVVLVGAVGGAYALGVVGTPSVVGVENRFGDVNETTTTIHTDMRVHNPNPIGVQLGGTTVSYDVRMNDVLMAEGTKEDVAVEQGNSTLEFRTAMNNSRIPAWWVSHVSNDEHTDLEVDSTVQSSMLGRSFDAPQVTREIDTSVIEAFRTEESQPIEADSPAVEDPVLYLNRTEASWGTVNDETTEVEMTLYLHNPKSYPIPLSSLGYNITMNGIAVGEGETGRTTTIPPGETVAVEAATHIDTQRLDEWWVSHLERDQVTELHMDLHLTFDLSSVGAGERRVRLDDFNETVETDVFGTKNATAAGSSDDGDTENGDTDGSAGDDGTDGSEDDVTDTPTDGGTDTGADDSTPTATPTPEGGTTTTEDDGLL